MSPEQFTALLIAIAAVFGAVAKCIAELRAYHAAVNSKMDELLVLTARSSRAEGLLAGRSGELEEPAPVVAPNVPWSARVRRGHN
jgi:hypothetical protein